MLISFWWRSVCLFKFSLYFSIFHYLFSIFYYFLNFSLCLWFLHHCFQSFTTGIWCFFQCFNIFSTFNCFFNFSLFFKFLNLFSFKFSPFLFFNFLKLSSIFYYFVFEFFRYCFNFHDISYFPLCFCLSIIVIKKRHKNSTKRTWTISASIGLHNPQLWINTIIMFL